MQNLKFYQRVLQLLREDQAFAIAYLVRAVGSTPRAPGAKMIVYPDGRSEFTIGGGAVEARVSEEAQLVAGAARVLVRRYALSQLAMHCGGTMRFFCEGFSTEAGTRELPFYQELLRRLEENRPFIARYAFDPQAPQALQKQLLGRGEELAKLERSGRQTGWALEQDGRELYLELLGRPARLLIFGAGHVGEALGKLAAISGAFRVEIADDRPEYANRERLPFAAAIYQVERDYLGPLPQPDPCTYVAIITRCHQTDQQVLRQLLQRDPDWPYTGMIGSRAKRLKLFGELEAEGIPAARLARVHSPMGLPLGGKEPGEIAVSILAELVQLRGATGR